MSDRTLHEQKAPNTPAAPKAETLDSFEVDGGWTPDPADESDELLPVPAVDPAIYGIENDASDIHAAAARGISTPAGSLPHLDRIQQAFGAHDVSGIEAHVGGSSAADMGATAFAAGNHVVFDREPDLHTAAHEAAHVVQQARGLNLYGGVGEAGDAHERAADAIADRVVAGQSASDLLGVPVERSSSPAAVQRKELTRSDYTMRADGDRAGAISAHLRLAAMKIQNECDVIEAAMVADPEEMGSQGVMDAIITPAFAQANEVQRTLVPIWEDMHRLGFKDNAMRDGLGIINTAKRRFSIVEAKVRQWTGRNKIKMDGASAAPVERTVDRFGQTMGVPLTGSGSVWGTEDKNVDETDLIKETVSESIDAIDASASALGLAMREQDPKASAPAMAQRALMDLRLLDASIPANAKTSEATSQRIAKIALRMEAAWIDAGPSGLQKDGNMVMAIQLMRSVKAKLDKAKNAKARK